MQASNDHEKILELMEELRQARITIVNLKQELERIDNQLVLPSEPVDFVTWSSNKLL